MIQMFVFIHTPSGLYASANVAEIRPSDSITLHLQKIIHHYLPWSFTHRYYLMEHISSDASLSERDWRGFFFLIENVL